EGDGPAGGHTEAVAAGRALNHQGIGAARAIGRQRGGGAQVLIRDPKQVVDAEVAFVVGAPWSVDDGVVAGSAEDGEVVVSAFPVIHELFGAARRGGIAQS